MISRIALTDREKDILKYIIRFKEVNGYSPTVREIARGTYSSVARVHDTLERLQELGYLQFKSKSPRTINVLKFIS